MAHDGNRSNGKLESEFSPSHSGNNVEHFAASLPSQFNDNEILMHSIDCTVDDCDLTESDRDDLVHTLESSHDLDDDLEPGRVTSRLSTRAKGIPVPPPQHSSIVTHMLPASQASSQGSSGSAFLSSVLNPAASTFGNSQLSHTPPAASSFEISHFGKRLRAGSVSGRIRSASDYLEEKGLLDRQTKGILKDLIIIGDEEIQLALDRYETGDPSVIEDMIRSGALQKRLPQDLDILGDLDLDFLNVHDYEDTGPIEPLIAISTAPDLAESLSSRPTNLVSPPYDDGVGDLDFAGDFVTDQTDYTNMHLQPHLAYMDSKQVSAAGSPQDAVQLSEYDYRIRSNSLFSALLNDPNVKSAPKESNYGNWLDTTHSVYPGASGIVIGGAGRRATIPGRSGIGAILEAGDMQIEQPLTKKDSKAGRKRDDKKKSAEADDREVHVPGSGMPRSLSDPNLRSSVDEQGFMHVDRPDGWVGAYSPDSRKVRIERFLDKRNTRVWKKTVKYDVRKNFADSRLRVKGRFVKKEDEQLMRELMSLT